MTAGEILPSQPRRSSTMRPILACLAVLLLTACSTVQRVDAAADVHSFLVSIRDNDGHAFSRYVDRPAIASNLAYRLRSEARQADMPRELRAIALVIAAPAATVATEALIRPSVLRLVAEEMGYRPDRPLPRTFDIAGGLRSVDSGRVCAAKSKRGPCLLTFAHEGDTWKLVSIDAPLKDLKF
jgi:hypothetical protein